MRTSAPFRVVLLLAVAIGAASCDYSAPPQACSTAMPPSAAFVQDAAFAPLHYHRRTDYEVVRGTGYDLWADSRFIYRAGLEFTLVPAPGANADRLCARAVALRMALPLREEDRRRLSAFVHIASHGTLLDEKHLLDVLEKRLAAGDKYGAIALESGVTIEGGRVTHPSRGEFFVVAFSWPTR